MMQTHRQQQDHDLDTLLLLARAPEPRTDFTPRVWRQIRLSQTAASTTPPWAAWLSWPQTLAYGTACLLLLFTGLTAGQNLGRISRARQTETRIPTLDPQTLAGAYLAAHTGR
jgi:hypothetical protein